MRPRRDREGCSLPAHGTAASLVHPGVAMTTRHSGPVLEHQIPGRCSGDVGADRAACPRRGKATPMAQLCLRRRLICSRPRLIPTARQACVFAGAAQRLTPRRSIGSLTQRHTPIRVGAFRSRHRRRCLW